VSGVLSGRIALVTGAGSGMGRTHCEVMAERGAHVIVQELIADRAEAVAAAIRAAGGSAEAMPGDSSDVARMNALVAEAEKRLGHIDILVNNAGISGLQAPFEQVDEAAFDRI
jgi:NAD(P)-dependent dehydrogenase (short-subunit alcohol dehydrogenase family)